MPPRDPPGVSRAGPYEIWLLSCPGYCSKRLLASSLSASPAGGGRSCQLPRQPHSLPTASSLPWGLPAWSPLPSCALAPPCCMRAVTDVAAVHPDAVPVVLAVAFHGIVGEVTLCHFKAGVDHDLWGTNGEGGSPMPHSGQCCSPTPCQLGLPSLGRAAACGTAPAPRSRQGLPPAAVGCAVGALSRGTTCP